MADETIESPPSSAEAARSRGRALARQSSIFGPILESLQRAVEGAEAAADSRKLPRLLHEAKIQDVSLKLAEMQARVAQELAIAERIQNAEEVEIEESYEHGGKGSVGLTAESETSANLGLSGEHKRVSKRVYRFKGYLGSHA